VHDIEEIVEREEELDKTIKLKQNHLLENLYSTLLTIFFIVTE